MEFKIYGARSHQAVIDNTVEVVQTPQEVKAEVARERRVAKKERQLDRKVKRQNKRSQAY